MASTDRTTVSTVPVSIETATVSTFQTVTSNNPSSEESTVSMTTLSETENTNSTVPGDQSQHTSIVIYVMIPVVVLVVFEVFIFIVLLRRCYAKKNANIGIYSRHNSDCEQDQHSILAIENKAYTGFVPPETQTDDSIITGNPKNNTDGNNINTIKTWEQRQTRIDPGYLEVKIESPAEAKETREQRYRKKIDPGYLEVEIESPETMETENSHRIKSRTTEFVNRTYSHIEGSPSFQQAPKVVPPYAHVDLIEGDDNYNRLYFKTQNDDVKKVQVETEAENDTEYDHTSSVRKRQPIKDDKNYSHLSIVIPRPQTIVRNKDVTVTRPSKSFMENEFTKPHTTDTKGNYEKRKTSVDYQQDLMSSIETKHKSLYSEVIKDIGKKRHDITTRKHIETEKRKLNDTSRDMNYEYSQVVKKTKSPVKKEVATANPLAKDNHACFITGDENDYKGRKGNQNNDYIDNRSREMKYEYSQVVKKTKCPVRNEVEAVNSQAQPNDNQACFIIGDENDYDGGKKNQNNEYINIVKQQ